MEARQRKEKEEALQKQAQLQAQEQAEQVVKFLQGEGGVAINSMGQENAGTVPMETESSDQKSYPTPPPLASTTDEDEVAVVNSSDECQVQGDQSDVTVAHSGSRDSPIEIDRAGATPTSKNLTATDYQLAQVLPTTPATAVVMGSVTTPYQVQPSAPPPNELPLQSQQQPQAQFPPASQPGMSPYQPTPPPNYAAYQQAPPSNYSSTYQQAPPPPYNPMVVTPTTPPVAVSSNSHAIPL